MIFHTLFIAHVTLHFIGWVKGSSIPGVSLSAADLRMAGVWHRSLYKVNPGPCGCHLIGSRKAFSYLLTAWYLPDCTTAHSNGGEHLSPSSVCAVILSQSAKALAGSDVLMRLNYVYRLVKAYNISHAQRARWEDRSHLHSACLPKPWRRVWRPVVLLEKPSAQNSSEQNGLRVWVREKVHISRIQERVIITERTSSSGSNMWYWFKSATATDVPPHCSLKKDVRPFTVIYQYLNPTGMICSSQRAIKRPGNTGMNTNVSDKAPSMGSLEQYSLKWKKEIRQKMMTAFKCAV